MWGALDGLSRYIGRIGPEEAAIGRPAQTARRLVEASVSPNTRRAYAGALRCLDMTLAAYLAELHDAGRASSSATRSCTTAIPTTPRQPPGPHRH